MVDDLITKIEHILANTAEALSEYELITLLRDSHGGVFKEADLQNSFELFQVHFLLFHCLYRLRDRWLSENKACLQIDAMKIRRLPYTQSNIEALTVADSLRAYYLDLSQLKQTSEADAENLINDFWLKFVAAADRSDALKALELEEGVSFDQIKQQYRQLAMQHHPDRGGSATKLADVNRAMDVLKRYYQ